MEVLLLLSLAIYFVPVMVACTRGRNDTMAIVMLNIFLGWTLIGWVAALVLACTKDVKDPFDLVRAKQEYEIDKRNSKHTPNPVSHKVSWLNRISPYVVE
jgi:hypothetical protein